MSLQGNSTFPFDPHTEPHHYVTTGQLTLFTIWIGSGFIWLLRFLRSSSSNVNHTDKTRLNGGHTNASNSTSNVSVETKVDVENGGGKSEGNNKNGDKTVRNFSTVKPPPTIDELLQSVLGFGMIMIFFYLCDYRKIFPRGERVYDRDTFLFLVFLLFLVGCGYTTRKTNDKILNRDQTEEWKGWMQVMFVWYHVFAAKEWYNWIRVYIAAYVWMTGFGNFSFFWVRKDFSLWRFLKMQFRLNFLVTCLCVVTS